MVQAVSSFSVIKRVFLGPTGKVAWRQTGVVVRPASSFVGLPWASFTSDERKKKLSLPAETIATTSSKSLLPKDWCWVYARSRAFSSSSPTHSRPGKVNKQTKPNLRIAKEINSRIIASGKRHDWKGILEIYEMEMEHFSFINYATSMSQLGRIGALHRDDARLEKLMNDVAMQLQSQGNDKTWGAQGMANVLHAVAKMGVKSNGATQCINSILGEENIQVIFESGNPQNIANTAWACATLGIQCPTLFQLIDVNASFLVQNGNPQAIANTAWACATLGIQCPTLFQLIDANASSLVESGTTQAIANIAWACATLGFQCSTLFNLIDANALKLIEDGKLQDISNIAWACATLGVQCPTLFQLIEANASYLVQNGKPQEIANTAWACATLGVQCPTFFKLIDANASYLIENGKPQEVANTAWAFATLGVQCPTLLKLIDAQASYIVENGSPQTIANTAWACATLGVECPTLFKLVDAKAPKLVDNGNAQDISNTAWACATLGVECPTLFQLVDANAPKLVENGKPQEVANTAWAFATLGIACPTLFNAMVSKMFTIVELGNEQAISTLCYSFAILDLAKDYESMFRILWRSAIKLNPRELSVVSCRQLLQTFVMVYQTLDIPPPNSDIQKVLCSLEDAPTESRSQREMSQLLVKLGFPHEVEVSPFQDQAFVVPNSFLAIDAACRERMIAIEFDGPFHFLKDITTTGKFVSEGLVLVENGPTKAKRRLLERLGWTVINIRYWEWISARTESEKMKLLSDKLSAAA